MLFIGRVGAGGGTATKNISEAGLKWLL